MNQRNAPDPEARAFKPTFFGLGWQSLENHACCALIYDNNNLTNMTIINNATRERNIIYCPRSQVHIFLN